MPIVLFAVAPVVFAKPDPVIDITKPEIVGIDPIITKEVLDANPSWTPEWGG